ncbi:MAG: tetratricopeptide repeat protein [Planctomycetes bacterium]|nr:tetratricopeptide repeat protein [Planctomycetota bacterium]
MSAKPFAQHRTLPAAGDPSRSSRAINLPLLAGTIVLCAVLIPGVYVWHGFQMQRIAGALLKEADQREQDSEWHSAADYIYRYLALRPEDDAARVRLAKVYDKGAISLGHKSRSVELLYRAIGAAENTNADTRDLRLRLVERLVELQRFAEAEQQAKSSITGPDDAAAIRWLALAVYGRHTSEGLEKRVSTPASSRDDYADWLSRQPVGVVVEQALALNQGDFRLSLILVEMHRKPAGLPQAAEGGAESSLARARNAMDAVRTAHPDDPEALLACFQFFQDQDPERAAQDLARALQVAPKSPQVLLASALHSRNQAEKAERDGQGDQAASLRESALRDYRKLVDELKSANEAAHVGLGETLLAQGRRAEAIAAWKSSIQLLKTCPTLQLRLADVLTSDKQVVEAEAMLQKVDAAIRGLGATASPAARRQLVRASTFQWARLWLQRNEPARAAGLLEGILSDGEAAAEGAIWSLLAVAYSNLGEWDRAATAYEQANKASASNDLRLAAGTAWLLAGASRLAAEQYLQIQDKSSEARLAYAEAVIREQLSLAKAQRDLPLLGKVHEDLAELGGKLASSADSVAKPWRISLLRAEAELALGDNGDMARAQGYLADAESLYGNDPEFLQRVALEYEQLGAPMKADQALVKLQAAAATPDVYYLCLAKQLRMRGDSAGAKRVLQEGADKHTEYRASLDRSLALTCVEDGQFEEALKLFSLLWESKPDLSLARMAAEAALSVPVLQGEAPDLAEYHRRLDRWAAGVQVWEDRLLGLEGKDGSYWQYCRARRLVALAKSPDDPLLKEAAALQVAVQKRRPNWPKTHLLRGMVAERSARPANAIDAYEASLRLGNHHPFVYERLAHSLFQAGRVTDAYKLLDRMAEQVSGSQSLSELAMNSAARLEDFNGAEAIAKRGVASRPQDPLAWIWYGQVQLTAELKKDKPNLQQAEAAFQRAFELTAGRDIRACDALFGFFVRTGDKARAREVLGQMAAQAKFADEASKSLVLAQEYEILEDWPAAEQYYLAAKQRRADDPKVLTAVGAFYIKRGEQEKAIAELSRVVTLDPNSESPKRMLAVLLASQGGDEAWTKVRQLLGPRDGEVSHANERLRAVLLSGRGGKQDLGQARDILEKLVRDARNATPGDHLLLAWIYARESKAALGDAGEGQREQRRKLAAAREQYSQLVHADKPDAAHVAAYVDFLLNQSEWDEAASQLNALQRIEPASVRTLTLEARLLQGQGRAQELEERIGAWVRSQTSADQKQVLATAGQIFVQLKMHSQAEGYFRQLYALDSNRYSALALALAAQQDRAKTQAAIQLCLAAGTAGSSPEPVTILAAALVAAQAHGEITADLDGVMEKALANYPDQPQLLMSLANLRLLQGQNQRAEELYRRVTKLQPRDVVALNNLAAMLSGYSDDTAEAEQLINQAIGLAGEQPYLLDTKGVVLLTGGRAADAVALLERAAALDSDPRHLFHYAAALWRSNDQDRARAVWRALDRDQLREQMLTSKDQQLLDELSRNLGS